jgi:hypothetical protein
MIRSQHDLRRQAVRQFVATHPRARCCGSRATKTRSVFERYNIVNEGDLRVAAAKLDAAVTEAQGS